MSDLNGKTVIITGVGRPRGIGRASALRFAKQGANLVLADLGAGDRRVGDIDGISPDLEAVTQEGTATGAQAIAVATDVSVEADVETLVAAAVARFGQVDAMVATASKNTEAMMKLANDAFAPMSNRMSLAAEKVSKAA